MTENTTVDIYIVELRSINPNKKVGDLTGDIKEELNSLMIPDNCWFSVRRVR